MIQYVRHLFRRGTKAKVVAASGLEGEPYFATDTDQMYISNGTAQLQIPTCDIDGNLTISGDFTVGGGVVGATDHGTLSGLLDDDHTGYALLAGRSTGQTFTGATTASGTLTLASTSNGTKGKILFGTSAYDEVNNRLGIGVAAPGVPLSISHSLVGAFGDADNDCSLYIKNTNAGNTSTCLVLAPDSGNEFTIGVLSSGATPANGTYILNRNNTPMSFYTNGAERLTIAAAGGVTIAQTLAVSAAGSTIAQEAWKTVGNDGGLTTYYTGWSGTLKYMKDSMGFVHFQGVCSHASGGFTNICNIATGYAPGVAQMFYCNANDNSYAWVHARVDSYLDVRYSGSTTGIYLNFEWKAA
jgi:hypothetical protein